MSFGLDYSSSSSSEPDLDRSDDDYQPLVSLVNIAHPTTQTNMSKALTPPNQPQDHKLSAPAPSSGNKRRIAAVTHIDSHFFQQQQLQGERESSKFRPKISSSQAPSLAAVPPQSQRDVDNGDAQNPWAEYDGEAEEKAQALVVLHAQQRQRKGTTGTTSDESFIPEDSNDDLPVEETSKWYLPCDSGFATTHSSSAQYISFDYNTEEYYDSITKNAALYSNNVPLQPTEVAKRQQQDARSKKTAATAPDTSNATSTPETPPCYDSYNDICLSSVFKHNNRSIFRLNSPSPDAGGDISSSPCQLPISSSTAPQALFTPYDSSGVSFIRFFPQTSQHLLVGTVSGGVKLYSISKQVSAQSTDPHSHKQQIISKAGTGGQKSALTMTSSGCMREFCGHTKGLRDMQWVDDGSRFFTCSLDGWFKLWDTETGKVLFRVNTSLGKFRAHATPMCALVDHANATIGLGNGSLQCFDMRLNGSSQFQTNVSLEYDRMQDSVTTLLQLPSSSTYNNFLAAAGDGQVFVYQRNVPSIYQYVMTNERQMITRATLHPSNKFIIANTQSNNAVVFQIKPEQGGKVKLNKKQSFVGHLTAGFAPGITCSSDGKYVISGDGQGRVVAWNWNTGRCESKFTLHSDVCSDVAWATGHQSLMATCSWDGTVKVWGNLNKKVA